MAEKSASSAVPQERWMDQQWLGQLLREAMTVTSVRADEGVAAGENYSSDVSSIRAQTGFGEVALFIKRLPQTEFRAQFLTKMEVFKREATMYTRTLPLIRAGFPKPNFPACIYHELNNKSDMLILRDLRPDGYQNRPRMLGLDEPHCRLALAELAHLHGHSIAIRIQLPDVFENEIRKVYADQLYAEENRPQTQPFFASMLQGIGDAASKNLPLRFRGLAQEIKERLAPRAFDLISKHIQLPKDPEKLDEAVLCLNHGDFWSNNMLFKYDAHNQPIACSMVDFQMARCSSPVLDLLYFFFTSTEQSLRRAHMLPLLEFYMSEVRAALKARGVEDAGSRFYKDVNELHGEMSRAKSLGFVMACVVLPAASADPKVLPKDLDKVSEEVFKTKEVNAYAAVYESPRFLRLLKQLIEDFDDMGFFHEESQLEDI